MRYFSFGQTRLGLEIDAFHFEGEGNPFLLLGGVHGNEPEGFELADWIRSQLLPKKSFRFPIVVVPRFNPEGCARQSRVNSAGVDLNRNLPTKDWNPEAFNPKYPPGEFANSEPENQAFVKWIDSEKPFAILSLHSFERFMMNTNGDCEDWAKSMQAINQYPIEETIGYPTPGCLGTYSGIERGIPTITYELQRGLALNEIIRTHAPAIEAGLSFWERRQ